MFALLHIVPEVEVSDTTGDAMKRQADYKKFKTLLCVTGVVGGSSLQ
jgi:hypothetical protein